METSMVFNVLFLPIWNVYVRKWKDRCVLAQWDSSRLMNLRIVPKDWCSKSFSWQWHDGPRPATRSHTHQSSRYSQKKTENCCLFGRNPRVIPLHEWKDTGSFYQIYRFDLLELVWCWPWARNYRKLVVSIWLVVPQRHFQEKNKPKKNIELWWVWCPVYQTIPQALKPFENQPSHKS